MGNCIGKSKKNRVSPSPVKDVVVPKSRPESALLFQTCASPAEELVKQISAGMSISLYFKGIVCFQSVLTI